MTSVAWNDSLVPQLEPATTRVFFSYAQRQVVAAVLVLVSLTGLLGNTLVIAAVILSRRLHRTTNLFVLNLGLTDLLTCAFLPVQSVAVLGEGGSPLPGPLCSFAGFLTQMCLACSVNNLLCIAVNRFFLITKKASTCRRIYTPRRAVVMMLATWAVPIVTVAIPAFTGYITLGFDPKDSSCTWISSKSNPAYSYILFGTCVPFQFTLTIWSYARIFRFIRRHSRTVAHVHIPERLGPVTVQVAAIDDQDGRERPRRPGKLKLQIEVTKNLFLVLVAFMFCLTPFAVSLLLAANGVLDQALPFTATILTANSCVNPIIYGAKHPHFRLVFRCIITGRFSQIPDRIKYR